MRRFLKFMNSLPHYSDDAGAGNPIQLWEKRNNGLFRQYPKHRYHVNQGTTGRLYTDASGKQYILAYFVSTGSNIYYSTVATWQYLDSWESNLPATTDNHFNFQKLEPGEMYFFWRELEQPENPFLMIYPAEEDTFLTNAGFGRIPASGIDLGDIPVIVTDSPGSNHDNNTTLDQRSASKTPLLLIAGIGLLVVTGFILYFIKK